MTLRCEWHPDAARPARTQDPAHGPAVLELGDGLPVTGADGWGFLRVCGACAERPELAPLRARGVRPLEEPRRRLVAAVSGGPAETIAAWGRLARERSET